MRFEHDTIDLPSVKSLTSIRISKGHISDIAKEQSVNQPLVFEEQHQPKNCKRSQKAAGRTRLLWKEAFGTCIPL